VPVRPRQLVDPPAFAPLPYGLLSVVEPRNPADNHWQNGVTYQSRCGITMGTAVYDECIAVTTGVGTPAPANMPTQNTSSIGVTTRGATAFTPLVEFDCAPVGNDQAQKIATDALNTSAPYQVEQAFWTGIVAGQVVAFPHLAANATLTDAGGALLQSVPVTGSASPPYDVADGLGYLESQLAGCYSGVGVIHVPVIAIPTLAAWGLITVQGGQLRTLNGNRVAAGGGYPGTGPTGAAPTAGTVWLYATGAVFAYSGATRILGLPGALDRAENTIRMIAERTYVLGWDCCHVGVQVSLGVPVT
jgi:hypothetical protein